MDSTGEYLHLTVFEGWLFINNFPDLFHPKHQPTETGSANVIVAPNK
jgi:hypothetical protein